MHQKRIDAHNDNDLRGERHQVPLGVDLQLVCREGELRVRRQLSCPDRVIVAEQLRVHPEERQAFY